ncbi:MAG TPA: hypothetical protein VFI41_04985 [Gemmatimonadales bacterium]|nr:hypothetical protein [Gemmatimonadales bacterium]
MKSKPILALDFDGTLHAYTGWNDGVMNGPVPGALMFVERAMKYFTVVVVSSRCNDAGGSGDIACWLEKYGFPPLKVSADRPPAFVSLDDRALTFNGTWPSVEELRKFMPWWKR